MKDGHRLTDEQENAARLIATGRDTKVLSGAGTGKTALLVETAKRLGAQRVRGLALVFNRRNADELKERLVGTTFKGMTFNGLAFRSVGRHFLHRIEARDRMFQSEIADALGITRTLRVPLSVGSIGRVQVLNPRDQVGDVLDAVRRFSRSDAEQLGPEHFHRPLGIADDDWHLLLARLMPAALRMWADVTNVNGVFPYEQDYYVRQYLDRLRDGAIRDRYEVVLADECQDLSACRFAIAELVGQQRVAIGDTNQSIYGWNGAEDFMSSPRTDGWAEASLTGSFRFGDGIAEVANSVLAYLPTEMRMRGLNPVASEIGDVKNPDALLCRSNKGVMLETLAALLRGGRPYVVGGVDELVAFAQGALELQDFGGTAQVDLRYFSSWAQAIVASKEEAMFRDLELVLEIVDELTPRRVLAELARVESSERNATVVVSTAHRFKGMEADSVRLGPDFEDDPSSDEEHRIIYVAVTRARRALDVSPALCFVDGRYAPGEAQRAKVSLPGSGDRFDGGEADDLIYDQYDMH